MAMFNQGSRNEPASSSRAETFIGPSVKLEGNFDADGDIVVEGALNGNLSTKGDVRVGSQAVIEAEVKAASASIAGKLTGNLSVEGALRLAATAVIKGDVSAQSLAVEEGAVINGKVSMGRSTNGRGRAKAKPVEDEVEIDSGEEEEELS